MYFSIKNFNRTGMGLMPMITRGACRVTVDPEAEGGTGAGLAAWHICSAGRLLAAPAKGLRRVFFF